MNAPSPTMRSTDYPNTVWQQTRKIGPLGVVILLHVILFYALQNGLIPPVTSNIPKEVIVTFITPDRAPEPSPPKAAPTPPKVVPVVKKSVAPPPLPLSQAPTPTAITAPPLPAHPAEPSPPVIAAPAPAAPPGPSLPKQINSGIAYIQAPEVKYPQASKRLGEEGSVQFRVLVNASGKAEKFDLIKGSGFTRLDDEARRAVMQAIFKPYIEDGKPIVVSTTGVINFKIDR